MEKNKYDVVWPAGKKTISNAKLAKRPDTLNGKVIAELWDWVFKGDIMFEALRKAIKEQYPDATFISWEEFGEIHGPNEDEVLKALPGKLKDFNVDVVICGVGC
jgi:hypothetical protein